MTPQAILKARFSELAEANKVKYVARRQVEKYYFIVTGGWAECQLFMRGCFPRAWMTSGAQGETTYGLPLEDVDRVLAASRIDQEWLRHHDGAVLRIAQQVRDSADFASLPVLADALEEGGCTNREVLGHLRAAVPHLQTCWVVELLLGPSRKRRGAAGTD